MSETFAPKSGAPDRELPSEWTFGGEPSSDGDDLDDSLFAPPPPPPDRPRQGPPPPPPRPPSAGALTDAFHFTEPEEESDDPLTSMRPCWNDGPPAASVRPAVACVSTPKLGETLSGFLLLSELGRGAFARVFLAEQVDLGGRRVALKVSQAEGDEPQMLARLQHTHIVPIHSVHDDPVTGLRLMCMPYLGGANLAQVLDAVGHRATSDDPRRLSLVDALDEVSQWFRAQSGNARPEASGLAPGPHDGSLPRGGARGAAPHPPVSNAEGTFWPSLRAGSVSRLHSFWDRVRWKRSKAQAAVSLDDRDFDQPARHFLREANSIQGGVWIIARLAEGLEHAHTRGLLHRDLKPSNILITADGTPMLLDFNLSTQAAPGDSREGEKAMLGGTLPYMAPEHLDAFNPNGMTRPEAVDERADVYALGLILFETVAGRHPFPEPPAGMPLLQVLRFMADQRRTVPSLRAANPDVPWGLDSVVRKCLDPDPARRYARARDFAEDLNRFLADQPLKHAPERSVRERLAKWARRNPRVCGAGSIAAFSVALVVLLGTLVGALAGSVQTINARIKLQSFRADLAECRFLLNLSGGPREHLSRGVKLAQATLDHQGLRRDGSLAPDSWVNRLGPADRGDVRRETTELVLMEARARVDLSGRDGSEADRRAALEWAVRWLDRAERLDPAPPAALFAERARYHGALGDADLAARDRAAEAARAPESARDFTLRGSSRLARGDVSGAEPDLLRAVDLDPKSFWAWFTLGHCRYEQKRYLEAAGDFGACVALEPRFAWPYMNRGLALAVAGRLAEARVCHERAVQISPKFAEAWLNLALTQLELNDPGGAEHSLGRALSLGLEGPGVRLAWAEAKARRSSPAEAERLFADLVKANPSDPSLLTARGVFRAGAGADPAGARADLTAALDLDPRNARAHYGLGLLTRSTSPRDALAHADAALQADPNLIDALQLRAVVRARLGDLAAVDDVERICQSPTRHRLYNAACALAMLVDTAKEPRLASRALEKLDRAFAAGFPVARAEADPDLAPVKSSEAFRALARRYSGAAAQGP